MKSVLTARASIGVVALAIAVLAGCSREETPKPPAVAAVVDPLSIVADAELIGRIALGEPVWAEVRETMRVPGRIEVDETRMARIGSPVTGRITDLDATVGQQVRRGQVLATLNSTELSNVQLNYLREQSQRLQAQRAAERAEQLLQAEVIGTAEVQRRQSDLIQADAELNAAREQLKVLGMSDKEIQRLAETGTITSRTQVVASVSGTVIERRITEGQIAQPSDSIFLIADLSRVWIVADIPEQAAGLARVGEPAEAEIAALPGRVVHGSLAFVSPTVNPETRTVRARMDVANPDGLFKPAMLANLLIRGTPQKRRLIPAEAVVREDNRDQVFVQTRSDTFRLRTVSLGGEYERRRVLTDGLREGEKIVIDGAFHLNNERKRRALSGS